MCEEEVDVGRHRAKCYLLQYMYNIVGMYAWVTVPQRIEHIKHHVLWFESVRVYITRYQGRPLAPSKTS